VKIGIDQSYSETAITVLITPDNYNIFSIKGKGKTIFDKLFYIRDNFKFILDGLSEKPEVVCIEGGSYKSEGRLFSLGQLSGVLINSLFDWGVSNILEIPPKTLKKFISGMGDASKETVMKAIERKYHHVFKNDNKADSYSLAILAHRYVSDEHQFREEAQVIYNLKIGTKKKKKKKYTRKFNL